jgi:hypothetical protein
MLHVGDGNASFIFSCHVEKLDKCGLVNIHWIYCIERMKVMIRYVQYKRRLENYMAKGCNKGSFMTCDKVHVRFLKPIDHKM